MLSGGHSLPALVLHLKKTTVEDEDRPWAAPGVVQLAATLGLFQESPPTCPCPLLKIEEEEEEGGLEETAVLSLHHCNYFQMGVEVFLG